MLRTPASPNGAGVDVRRRCVLVIVRSGRVAGSGRDACSWAQAIVRSRADQLGCGRALCLMRSRGFAGPRRVRGLERMLQCPASTSTKAGVEGAFAELLVPVDCERRPRLRS